MVGGPTRKDMGTSHGHSEVIEGTFKGGMITFFTNSLSNFAMTKDPDSPDARDFDNQLLKIGIVV